MLRSNKTPYRLLLTSPADVDTINNFLVFSGNKHTRVELSKCQ